MTKIIGIDLDEVLAETLDQILEDNNFVLGNTKVTREDILDYYIFKNENLNLTLEESIKYFHEVYLNDNDLKIKIVSGTSEKIYELKNKGYTLKIVSARPVDLEDYTKKWLEKHFQNTFDSVHFANHFNYSGGEKKVKNKSDICKELGITVMVEDNFNYALELAQNGIYTFLIDKPWNKHIKETHSNIKKVKSWEDIII